MSGTRAIARRALADSRYRTIGFAYLFAAATYAQAYGYRHTYSTLPDRLQFARSVGGNRAVRLLYGEPHDLLSVGGYVSWRAGGSLAVFAAVWGLLGAVRAMRAEEEAGRLELVLTGTVSRRDAFLAQVAAVAAGAAVLWLAMFLALVAGQLHVGNSAYLALATVSLAAVFAGVGALTSQLAPTRRLATGLATGVLGIAFAVRVVADTTSGLGWLRWGTPLGWAEELRPFTGARPLALLLPAAATVLLLSAAGAIAMRRDIGTGLLPARDRAAPRLGLLGSPTALALREARGGLAAWWMGVGAFAFLLGVVSDTVTSGISENVQRQLAKIGAESVATPTGYLGFSFLFFVLAISLFCCWHVTAARRDESEGRLEALFALPVERRGWLAGRLLLAAASATAVALAAGLLAWAGAASQSADVSLPRMLEAGANCLPVGLLFLALGFLALAALPRAASAATYGAVTLAFVWELFGSLLNAPGWLLGLSPFHHVGLVPAEPFEGEAAAIMLALAAVAALAAAWIFERRDLVEA